MSLGVALRATGVCAALLTTMAAAACVPLPGGRELSRKTVWAKEGEATLVADDGARCEVSPARFERTRVGDDAACAWRLGDGAPDTRPAERNRRGPRPRTRP